MSKFVIEDFTKEYDEYMRDESRKVGRAESISFPQTEEEIIETLTYSLNKNKKVTIQGARTGITAGAVPQGGHVLNLGKMSRITGLRYDHESNSFYISVQPGVLLTDIRKAISNKDFDTNGWSEESLKALQVMKNSTNCFFPPDPTETSASIGGMVACNASGSRSFHYGPTRSYVEGLRIILSDGSVLSLKRGAHKAQGRYFSLTTDTGRIIHGELPQYTMPDVKNASGYYVKENMDLIDLFIGSEGTLGIISQIELRLLREPEYIWGLMFFFCEEESAVRFVKALREVDSYSSQASAKIQPAAIEYFNGNALELLRVQKESNAAFSNISDVNRRFHSAIYVELDGNTEDDVMESMVEVLERAESCGGSESDTWVASTPQLMENMKLFRHAVPEAVNLLVDQRRKENPDITKLGTDMAVPDDRLEEIMDMYKSDLAQAGFDSVMFGHIGDNHIHVNIIPRTMEEYSKGKELYAKWAYKVLEAGGTVSAEHGIGKLKVNFLKMMYGQEGIDGMSAVRNAFDPCNILNEGNLF